MIRLDDISVEKLEGINDEIVAVIATSTGLNRKSTLSFFKQATAEITQETPSYAFWKVRELFI
ncbi:MAG: hypothetical protein CMH15_10305 [Mesonia sp.]|nr:hypothetical protein [Mesonia sp.]MAQ41418.1 hypothetical protein [Mesonia sp.]|tara:strand:- start:52 stop:240 length:189 start_codon:yes stop_codon:yes gene_type:complete